MSKGSIDRKYIIAKRKKQFLALVFDKSGELNEIIRSDIQMKLLKRMNVADVLISQFINIKIKKVEIAFLYQVKHKVQWSIKGID